MDSNGGGLIAAPTDQSNAIWGCKGTSLGVTASNIGTGNQNTIDILAGCTTAGTAADICANLTLNGYSDWFLPSSDELNEMYLNIGQGNVLGLGNIGGFDNNYYWSSSESYSERSLSQNFDNGEIKEKGKNDSFIVRAVRAF